MTLTLHEYYISILNNQLKKYKKEYLLFEFVFIMAAILYLVIPLLW